MLVELNLTDDEITKMLHYFGKEKDSPILLIENYLNPKSAKDIVNIILGNPTNI